MQGAEEGSYSGCFACCWNLCFLLLFLLACFFLRLWHGQFQALPTWRDQPQPPSQGHKDDHKDSPRSRRRRSIRRLLCDSPTCSLCQQVAEEAAELAYPGRLGLGVPPTRAPVVPTAGQGERCTHPDFLERSPRTKLLRPARKPPPDRGPCHLPPGPPSPTGKGAAHLRHQAGISPKGTGHSVCYQVSCFSRASQRESTHSSMSSALDASFSSWTEGSSSAGSLQAESEEILSSSGRTRGPKATGKDLHRKSREGGCRRCHRCHRRKREPQRSPASRRAPAFQGVLRETPFLGKEARARLEWHLLRKRIQHAMGLPCTLLHSLRAFMPLAPNSAARSPPRSLVLALRPQPLPFLKPQGARTELEKHLKKMVHFRRWGLPRRVQEPLRHMGPGSQPLLAGRIPPAPKTSRLPGRRDLRPSSHRSPQRKAGGVELAYDHRNVHVARPLSSSAKVTFGTPEVLHWMGPSAHRETLESHVLKKRLQHQWGLPGLARYSMKQFLPDPPRPTAGRASPQRFLWGENAQRVLSQLPFIPQETKGRLEGHVQRLVVQRQWGLPWRVVESLRMFLPVSRPLAEKPKETSLCLRRPKGERPPPERAPACSGRPLGASGGPPAESCWHPGCPLLERHLAKKAVEIQLGALPNQGCSLRATCRPVGKQVLPKIIRPGQRAPLHRRRGQGLPFVDPTALSHVERLTHKRLAYKCRLPTLYTRSLARASQGITPPGPSLCSPITRTARVTFVATETRFLAREKQEALEWHIKKKQLQHLWGLPGLVQGSLRRLLPDAPRLCPPRGRGHETVAVLRSPLSFLSKDTQQRLEANVWKRVTLQRWRLPKMVLQSLRQLLPEMGLCSLREKGPRARRALPGSRLPSHDPMDGGFQRAEGTSESRPARSRGPPILGLQELQRLTDHLAKRSVEMHLGALPPLARVSWQLAQLDTWQPLPRLIRPGQGTWQPRRLFLPFLRTEDVDRIEMAVFRRHLSCLWGLAPRYVGALVAARLPHPSIPPLRPRLVGIEFSEGYTPFLPQRDREALEQHLRRKRMQHEWGVPALVQRSLRAILPASSPLPIHPKATIQVSILRQDAPFLPRSILSLLERHVQKRKLHRHWGLPRRVLGSLKLMCPKPRSFTSQQAVAPRSSCHALADSNHGGPPGPVSRGPGIRRAKRRILSPAAPPPVLLLVGTKHLEEIRLHLAKKYVEKQLGAFPALVQLSRRQASRYAKKPLPKPILPGQRPLRARRGLLALGRREDVEQIELAMRHHHLMSLWGLGPRCMRAQGGMLSRTASAPPLGPRRAAAVVRAETRLPFLREQVKEALEQHAKKKRIQHMWGFPVTIQRSLRSFMHKPPPSVTLCQKATTLVICRHWELSFFPLPACRRLELHVLKMKHQHLWGLPGRVLQSLEVFTRSRKQKSENESTRSRSRQGKSRSNAQGSRGAGGHAQSQGEAAATALMGLVPQGTAVQQRGRKGPGTQQEAPWPHS